MSSAHLHSSISPLNQQDLNLQWVLNMSGTGDGEADGWRRVDVTSLRLQWNAGKTSQDVAKQRHDNHFQISQCGSVKDKYRAYCLSENKLKNVPRIIKVFSNFSTEMSTSTVCRPKKKKSGLILKMNLFFFFYDFLDAKKGLWQERIRHSLDWWRSFKTWNTK